MIPIPSPEIVKNPNPNEENREIPKIDLLNNSNLLFHFRIPVLRTPIPFSHSIKRQTLVSQLHPPDPLFTFLSAGAILLVRVPATIITSAWR